MFVPLYTCIFVYEFYLGYIIWTQHMIFIYMQENSRKKLTKKELWTFEWPKMSHIFISPYHNNFWVDFIFFKNLH